MIPHLIGNVQNDLYRWPGGGEGMEQKEKERRKKVRAKECGGRRKGRQMWGCYSNGNVCCAFRVPPTPRSALKNTMQTYSLWMLGRRMICISRGLNYIFHSANIILSILRHFTCFGRAWFVMQAMQSTHDHITCLEQGSKVKKTGFIWGPSSRGFFQAQTSSFSQYQPLSRVAYIITNRKHLKN